MAFLEGTIDTLQHELAARFAGLREARGGAPVYALEHGLDAERLLHVRESVGAAVRRSGIGAWWRERSLPLLVVATEVGYGYRGTGTDFWPALCAAISAELSFTEHVRLSEFFAAAHQTVGLKKPADTPWNRVFNRIAWPISNAIAPLEIHRGLAQALHRVFQDPPISLDGDELAAALQAAARVTGSPRLQEWVGDGSLAVSLSRRLMRLDHDGAIAPEAIERIWLDLSADTVARRAIRQAMREQRGSVRSPKPSVPVSTQAILQLLGIGDGHPELVITAAFPVASDAQRRLLRGLSLAPWPGAEPIGLEAFFLGHPQALSLRAMPGSADAFLAGLDRILGDAVLCARLAAAGPDVTLPLVFTGVAGVAHQATGRTVSVGEEAWLIVAEPGALPDGVSAIGKIAGATCLHVPQPALVASWLSRHGIAVRDMAAIEAVRAAVVAHSPRGPVFGAGLPTLFRLTGGSDPALVTTGGGPGVTLSPDAPYLLASAGAGEHELAVSLQGRSSLLTWSSGTPDRDPEPPLELALDPAGASVEMLRRGEVAVHVRTSLRMPPVTVALSVVTGELTVARTRAFGLQAPVVLTASGALMGELIQQLDEVETRGTGDTWLVVDLEGICREWWPLNREVRRVAWERHDQKWTPQQDGHDLGTVTVEAGKPLRVLPAGEDGDADTIRLLLPVAAGELLDEAGFVVGPRRLNFAAEPRLPQRLGRSWRSADELPARDVSLGYLRWSCAEARNPVVDVGRRRVAARLEAATVVQFCGEAWAQTEETIAHMAADVWTALAEAAVAAGLTAGEDLPTLDGWKAGAFTRHLAQRMGQMVPALWPAGDVTDQVAEHLDLAVGEAWEDLFQEIQQREGRFVLEDVDPGNSTAAWAGVVHAADAQIKLTGLLRSVLPPARAHALAQPDYQDLSLEEVGDLLIGEHVDLSPRGQPRWLVDDDIRRALLFWVRPAALSADASWSHTLERLLSDRQTARAVRYAALRYAASRGRRA